MKDMLELHLTCGTLQDGQISLFVSLCEQVGLRPLLIDSHHGEPMWQPSATAWLRADLEEAKAEAMALAQWLARAGMAVLGVKVDARVSEAQRLGRPGQYFEWRGKLRPVSGLHELSALRTLCEAHGAQLSRDGLREEADTCFVTLRGRASLAEFSAGVDALTGHLAQDGWPLLQQDSELCLHDSREPLEPDLFAAYVLPPAQPT
ncbi:hypothetical protein SAMN05216567_12073 [Variovorax sp. OK605]|jgi:hypothetical protein|uniref:hypothetical protein n=1 Tax=unclassified Variovorax TaxID=663243 RepID=UPI0008D3A70B|nr:MULTISPECIES: hypothetical protein [unclassified Variovorax]SEK15315.1 hypothetical protein SAMN05518853_11759 [Variovorax sp. OK202]SFE12821.1 hypothetical protein SAMN05444746_11759 [Variovorax sp. OK212]SFQ57468.1 hypothetical protein SAMN05216567_12073 [Variovorax sp. OK605]